MKKTAICLVSVMIGLSFALPAHAMDLSIPASSYQGSTFVSYTVRGGDTLYDISRSYGFDAETLAAINNINDARKIEIGQQLMIPTYNDFDHRVTPGEDLDDLASIYGVEKGQIASANDIWQEDSLPVGARINIPGLSYSQVMAKSISARNQSFHFIAPVQGVITSPYGYRGKEFHTGLDIACDYGKPVAASARGQVISAGWDGNYGYAVVIDHKNGYKTRYAHNSRLKAKVGDYVAQGETIAYVGSTGRSTGPHVHLEIIFNGITKDPKKYISLK